MSLILDGTNGETFPSWTTATRPASPAVGQMGYNTTTGNFDMYTASGWVSGFTSAGGQLSGNLTFASGTNGIIFNNSSALTNSTLNDYETGTWTPVWNGLGSNPTITYSTQSGYYTKIGNMVYLTFRLGISSISGGSGQLVIRGMPFLCSTASNNFGALSLAYPSSGWSTAAPTYGRFTGGNNFMELYYLSNTTTEANINVNFLTTSAQLIMNIWYQAQF